jgi:tetratricopeptide (TPR) repeat protein
MTRPVPAALLPSLAGPHLDQRGQVRLKDQDAFATGLAWATRDINPNVSLLQPTGPDSYTVYDYALDRISKQGIPVPDGNWAVIMANADAAELTDIGYTAEVTYQRTDAAIQAFRKAASSGHADAAPLAEFNLGVLLEEQGDADGAKAAYRQAIDSGHADAAPTAARNLGVLLKGQGDADGAKAAYRQAIDSGHADQAPRAAVNLGVLLEEQGDADGAKAAYQQAIDSGHAEAAPMAARNLGLQ